MIEIVDDTGKVGQRSGQPVDLVNPYDIDLALPSVEQHGAVEYVNRKDDPSPK